MYAAKTLSLYDLRTKHDQLLYRFVIVFRIPFTIRLPVKLRPGSKCRMKKQFEINMSNAAFSSTSLYKNYV
jgi:hypothetical protein